MPSLKLDHVVHYVNDLDRAIDVFEKNKLVAFHGGSHTQWGTYNALSYFGLTYIEFMGIENRELVVTAKETNLIARESADILPEREILHRVALRTDDIEGVEASLKSKGLELSPILDGKRFDKEGRLIEWRMMTIAGDFQGIVYPFVIQWGSSDEERLKQLRERRIDRPHPAGEVRVKGVVFHVQDPEAVALHWENLFGFPFKENPASEESTFELASEDHSFVFTKGDENRLTELHFQTSSTNLKGKTLNIGEGKYIFR